MVASTTNIAGPRYQYLAHLLRITYLRSVGPVRPSLRYVRWCGPSRTTTVAGIILPELLDRGASRSSPRAP